MGLKTRIKNLMKNIYPEDNSRGGDNYINGVNAGFEMVIEIIDELKIASQQLVEADADRECEFCHDKATGSETIYFCEAHRTD